jgi:agmatine/peptidylarginine deiminase
MVIEDETLLANTTNFQIFMTVMMDKTAADKKAMVIDVLTVLFPGFKIIFTPRTLLLNNDGLNIIIDENNFEIL